MRRWIALLLSLVVLAGLAPLAVAGAPPVAAAGLASRYVPVGPKRLLDTRSGPRPGSGAVLVVPVATDRDVPHDATAAVLTVTVTDTSGPGYVTVWPAGEAQPLASNLNVDRPGTTVPNLVTVRLGAGGAVAVFVQTSANVVVDVSGAYVPAPSGAGAGRLVTNGAQPLPLRLVDTRGTGGPLGAGGVTRIRMPWWVPADASAAVVNLTVTQSLGAGYFTAWPAGPAMPLASSLNSSGPGETVAAQAIVPLGRDPATGLAAFDVYAQTGGHLIVDLSGWFTGPSDPVSTVGLFVPLSPARLLDTRSALNPLGAGLKPQASWSLEVPVAGRAGIGVASAAVFNVTMTSARGPGFVTAWPAGQSRPQASTINATRAWQTVANHALLPLGGRGLALFTDAGSHLVVDVSGYYTGTPLGAVVPPPTNPAIVFPGAPFRLIVPRLGIDTTVREGIDAGTLAAGPGHWPGTANPGQGGNVAIFGHRTSHTAPFRWVNLLQPGDAVIVQAFDVTAVYTVAWQAIVAPTAAEVVTGPGSGSSLTLVSCEPPGLITARLAVGAGLSSVTWS